MNKFYTFVAVRGNKILYRGYEDGNQFQDEIEYKPTLFVLGNKGSGWKTLDGKSVEPIQFDTVDSAREFMEKYKKIRTYPIYGNTDFTYQFIADEYPNEVEYDPSLIRTAYIDIETQSENGFPSIKDANEKVNVITIIAGDDIWTFALGEVDETKITAPEGKKLVLRTYDDERQMLAEFLDLWQQLNFDIVTGWNVQFFDIPYLVNRLNAIGGSGAGKNLSPWKKIRERNVEMNGREQQAYDLTGINTLDYIDLYRKFTYVTRESYKLDHIAKVELGESKLSYVEHDNFADFYRKDFTKFVQYNIQDTLLVQRLEEKLRLMELAITLAYSAKVNMQDVFSQVRTWDQIIYHHLNKKKIVIPQKHPSKKDTSFEGAYVKDPILGMHKWVVSFDLDSLYPHLIMQYNLSPDTKTADGVRRVIQPSSLLNPGAVVQQNLSEWHCKNLSIAANGTTYRKDRRGFLPDLMDSMYQQRKHYKNLMLDAKAKLKSLPKSATDEERRRLMMDISKYHNFQLVRKIQLNSAFGAVGNEWFRYYDEDIAEAITLSGQLAVMWIERTLNKFLNSTCGSEDVDYVLAIDTDSVYLNLDPLVRKVFGEDEVDDKKITMFLNKICEEKFQDVITKSYDNLAKYMNAYEQKMHMKREMIANKGIFKAKKRYMLSVRMGEENVYLAEPELKIMGIETARSSTPEVVRKALKDVISIVLSQDEETVQEFVRGFRDTFLTLGPSEIAFPRGCNGLAEYSDPNAIYKKGTPIAVKGSLIFNANIRKHGLTGKYQVIREGEKIKFIYLKTPNPVGEKVISFMNRLPEEFDLGGYIDYDTQFEKTFLEPLRSILEVIGWKEEPVANLESLFS
jgi:DNA polymerase elongation subunit (family B)